MQLIIPIVFSGLSLYMVANGVYLALSPRNWLRSPWTPPRGFAMADLESGWQQIQMRVMGVLTALFGLVFMGAVWPLPLKAFTLGLMGSFFLFSRSSQALLLSYGQTGIFWRTPTDGRRTHRTGVRFPSF